MSQKPIPGDGSPSTARHPPPLHPPSLWVGVGDGKWQHFLRLSKLGETWCLASHATSYSQTGTQDLQPLPWPRLSLQTLGQVGVLCKTCSGPLAGFGETTVPESHNLAGDQDLPFLLQTSLPHSVFPERVLAGPCSCLVTFSSV